MFLCFSSTSRQKVDLYLHCKYINTELFMKCSYLNINLYNIYYKNKVTSLNVAFVNPSTSPTALPHYKRKLLVYKYNYPHEQGGISKADNLMVIWSVRLVHTAMTAA